MDRDKASRLISQIDLFEGGSVRLPKEAPWLEEFVAELLSSPGRHGDKVDTLAQGLAWRREGWKAPPVQLPKEAPWLEACGLRRGPSDAHHLGLLNSARSGAK